MSRDEKLPIERRAPLASVEIVDRGGGWWIDHIWYQDGSGVTSKAHRSRDKLFALIERERQLEASRLAEAGGLT